MSTKQALGKVTIVPKGAYDAGTTYQKLDVVTYSGSSYMALQETTGHAPTSTTYWELLAQKGDTGSTGQQGPKGDTGNPGASPIAVSDAADMVDTTKIYVLTTDGHWYWYSTDNTQWEDGGTYQATGDSESVEQLKKDVYGSYTINEHDLLADKLGETLTSLDAQTTITDSDNSPSRQINISNLTGDLSGASLDLGTLFNPFTDGTYYLNFKAKAKRNSASSYQTRNIQVYMYLDSALKGSLGIPIDAGDDWEEYTKPFTLVTGESSNINKFIFYCNTKYDYEIKDIYITNDDDYNTGYFTPYDGISKADYKKISIIGDSLSAVNDTASTKYHDLLHSIIGFNINNVAVSGAGYSNGSNAGGTNDHQFYNQALLCDKDSDLFLIFGGFNDVSRLYGEYTTLGQLGDTGTTTIYGCIYNTFNNIYSLNPLAKIGVILPTPWRGYNTLMANDNPYKIHVDGVINALIQSCEHYCIPYLDLYHNSSLRPWDEDVRTALYYQADGTHPNNAGHADYIYPQVKDFIKQFFKDRFV